MVRRGTNVIIGYYKDPARARSVVTDDGLFKTNDLATDVEKGRSYIKGRLSNMILGPSGENIYPEEIENVINNMDEVNESIVVERDGRLVALVQFNDNIINWNQEGEDQFFEKLEARKKAILNYVNKQVNKFAKINEGEVMKEHFEKTATQKNRRFKYNKEADKSGKNDPDNSEKTPSGTSVSKD